MTNFRLYATLILFALLAACSGGGDGGGHSDNTSTFSSPSADGWPGRIWFKLDGVLYATSYSDEKKVAVASSLQLDSLISPIVRPNESGEYVLVYSADSQFTRTNFSIRSAADARELYSLTAERGTYSAALSNNGRFMAWQWADKFDADSHSPATFSIIELRSPAEGGVRWIADIPNLGGTQADLKNYRWIDGDLLIYINSLGGIHEYSMASRASTKIFTLPAKYNQYPIDFGSVKVSFGGDKIAGLMSIDENHRELWSSDIDGSNFNVITAAGLGFTTVVWSPDGRWLHAGDCRLAEYGGTPTYSIPTGQRSWILPLGATELKEKNVRAYAAKYLHPEVYDFYMPCGFSWTR